MLERDPHRSRVRSRSSGVKCPLTAAEPKAQSNVDIVGIPTLEHSTHVDDLKSYLYLQVMNQQDLWTRIGFPIQTATSVTIFQMTQGHG